MIKNFIDYIFFDKCFFFINNSSLIRFNLLYVSIYMNGILCKELFFINVNRVLVRIREFILYR